MFYGKIFTTFQVWMVFQGGNALKKYYFLPEDFKILQHEVEQLRESIFELGRQQGIANAQSTENFGHDDAVQETITIERNVALGRLRNLRDILMHSSVVHGKGPFDKVVLGATVKLSNGKSFRIGSYQIFAEHPIQTISYDSGLAKLIMGLEEGDEFSFKGEDLTIDKIS